MSEHEPTEASVIRASSTPSEVDTTADAAFTAFYRAKIKQLIGFLVLHGASLTDAAEVAHDTLSLAYRRWNTIDSPWAWSCRTASRAWGRKRFRAENTETLVAEPPEPRPSPVLRAPDLDRWELLHDILQALDALPPRQRQVMAWTLCEFTPAEISRELSMNEDAVRANLYKARRALAARLDGREGRND